MANRLVANTNQDFPFVKSEELDHDPPPGSHNAQELWRWRYNIDAFCKIWDHILAHNLSFVDGHLVRQSPFPELETRAFDRKSHARAEDASPVNKKASNEALRLRSAANISSSGYHGFRV